ncbi:MAG: hypothetical protein M1376_09020 [Planctomycetes bacterium]|nr:hypothetical protein [Planctomycetota bacterium]
MPTYRPIFCTTSHLGVLCVGIAADQEEQDKQRARNQPEDDLDRISQDPEQVICQVADDLPHRVRQITGHLLGIDFPRVFCGWPRRSAGGEGLVEILRRGEGAGLHVPNRGLRRILDQRIEFKHLRLLPGGFPTCGRGRGIRVRGGGRRRQLGLRLVRPVHVLERLEEPVGHRGEAGTVFACRRGHRPDRLYDTDGCHRHDEQNDEQCHDDSQETKQSQTLDLEILDGRDQGDNEQGHDKRDHDGPRLDQCRRQRHDSDNTRRGGYQP